MVKITPILFTPVPKTVHSAKVKIRLYINREKDGNLIIIPIADEIAIPMPAGESFKSLLNYALTIDVKPESLQIETFWERDHEKK